LGVLLERKKYGSTPACLKSSRCGGNGQTHLEIPRCPHCRSAHARDLPHHLRCDDILQCGNYKLFGHRILLYGYRTSAEYARGGADGNREYAAMALGAFDSIYSFFSSNGDEGFDLVLTGDLGFIGSEVLCELLCERLGSMGQRLANIHNDCGMLLYDRERQDVHAGASGCGCSASVLASYILPRVSSGQIRKMALLSTGALMSTSSVYQGEHILGIAPLIVIEHNGEV